MTSNIFPTTIFMAAWNEPELWWCVLGKICSSMSHLNIYIIVLFVQSAQVAVKCICSVWKRIHVGQCKHVQYWWWGASTTSNFDLWIQSFHFWCQMANDVLNQIFNPTNQMFFYNIKILMSVKIRWPTPIFDGIDTSTQYPRKTLLKSRSKCGFFLHQIFLKRTFPK